MTKAAQLGSLDVTVLPPEPLPPDELPPVGEGTTWIPATNESVFNSALVSSDGARVMVPSTGTGAVVVVVVDEVTLGGVVLSLAVAVAAGGDVGAATSFVVQPATATTAVRAAVTANAVRLGVVVVITVSLQERRQGEWQPADAPEGRLCAR
ncbi:MAG TPA: hypothetical protein VFR40_10990 [Lapillicoccus sp.]|nr:hypothetical protein [Lapillicoccus sp.]